MDVLTEKQKDTLDQIDIIDELLIDDIITDYQHVQYLNELREN